MHTENHDRRNHFTNGLDAHDTKGSPDTYEYHTKQVLINVYVNSSDQLLINTSHLIYM